MDLARTRTEKLRRISKPLGLLVVLGFVGLAAYWFIGWRQREDLASEARALMENGDDRAAALVARRALQSDSSNISAMRVLAEAGEKKGADSLHWRQKIAQARPHSREDLAAWAGAALRSGNFGAAEEALAALEKAAPGSAEYHTVAGALAVSRNDLPKAQTHYAQALRLVPENEAYQLNEATVRLKASGTEARREARGILERLSGKDKFRQIARRTLVLDLLASVELRAALKLADQLAADPQATFDDRLIYLELLRRTESDKFSAYLEEVKSTAASTPEKATALLAWMIPNGMLKEAVAWGTSLAPETLSAPQVGLAIAFAYQQLGDWRAVQALPPSPRWPERQHLRLALAAWAQNEQGDLIAARALWTDAIQAAQAPDALKQLAELAREWGWEDERLQAIRRAAERDPQPGWALQVLYEHYASTGNTRQLLQTVTRLVELKPSDEARNNLAMYRLLLGERLTEAHSTAAELYARHPLEPAYVSTYAWSLHLRGRSPEAAGVMERLKPEQLEEPVNAAYFGIILAAIGKEDRAARFLELGKRARLLPEEEKLLVAAGNRRK